MEETAGNDPSDDNPDAPASRPSTKRRRIHLGAASLEQLEHTLKGSQALTTPALVKKSSLDPNRNLHPSFKTAKEIYNPASSLLMSRYTTASTGSASNGRQAIPGKKGGKKGTMASPGKATSPGRRRGRMDKQEDRQQTKLDSFFKKSTHAKPTSCESPVKTPNEFSSLRDAAPVVTCSPLKSVMRSPIKLVAGSDSLYTSSLLDLTGGRDDDGDFADTFAETKYRTPKNSKVFTKLFNAQKNKDLSAGNSRKGLKTSQSFIRNGPTDNYMAATSASFSSTYSAPPCVQSVKQEISGDRYGLLGTGQVPVEADTSLSGVDYFAILPLEVLENIFCRLPLIDLCLNLARVCHRWNEIIADDKFLPWKKRYYRVLSGDHESRVAVLTTMVDAGMKIEQPETVLPGLIMHMKHFKPITATNMMECLAGHSKYQWAVDLLRERLPEHLNPWSVVVALVILSDCVADVTEVITSLLQPSSECTSLELVECLYSLAAYLLVLKSLKYRAYWTGLHYRLYYALYLFENECTTTCGELSSAFSHGKGQQTILKYGSADGSVRYTHEQLRICNHNVKHGDTLKIVAFAGTGKTTTLIRYTQLRPKFTFLLVVYNKSMAEHARGRFPRNVEIRTSHSLAFRKVGFRYKDKLGNLKLNSIIASVRTRKGEDLFVQAKFVQDTLTNFMASADRDITTAHVPLCRTSDTGVQEYLGVERRENLARDAKSIWLKMLDVRDAMTMTHDGYLKVYQLQRPQLSACDVILIDEAQDLTPAVADLLLSQQQPKILVGDPHQQIYSFRGAINAMDTVRGTAVYYLTQSFRFGSEIAFIASCCLELLKDEKKKILVGNSSKGCITGETYGQVAVITRSNYQLFNEAVKKCCFSTEQFRGAFVGGLQGFGFDMIMDIYRLMLPQGDRQKEGVEIRHPLIKKFSNFPELEKFATKTMDTELLGKIRIVKSYHSALPSHIKKIQAKCWFSVDTADIVFSTAHKSKGLEFSTVRLSDDYYRDLTPAEATNARQPADVGDEINLLYVAVTRAKRALQLTPTLMHLLDQSGEKFRYPVHSKALTRESPELTCLLTDRVFEPRTAITLCRKAVTLGTGETVKAGSYCPQVVTEDLPVLARLLGSPQGEGGPVGGSGPRRVPRVRLERDWHGLAGVRFEDMIGAIDFE